MGDRVRELRKSRYWTQDQLAHAAGVSRASVQNIEAGRLDRSSVVPKIAEALGVAPASLTGPEDKLDLSEGEESLIVSGDREALDKLRRLDDRGRSIIMAALDAALKDAGEEGV